MGGGRGPRLTLPVTPVSVRIYTGGSSSGCHAGYRWWGRC